MRNKEAWYKLNLDNILVSIRAVNNIKNWRKPIILAGLYLTVICEKGIFQKVDVTGRETKYILTRHKPTLYERVLQDEGEES